MAIFAVFDANIMLVSLCLRSTVSMVVLLSRLGYHIDSQVFSI
jgi:hypothetical protein